MIMRKVFHKNGNQKVVFAADSKEQIQKWLGDVDYDFAVSHATAIDDDIIFGKALLFPCIIIDDEVSSFVSNDSGDKLTVEYLLEKGFEKEVIKGEVDRRTAAELGISMDDDEIMYIKDGITIYWDAYNSEYPFSYATYVRGDGRFKGGFVIKTESQLNNLYYALAGIWL